MLVLAKLLKYITISYLEPLAAEVCFRNKSPIPRLNSLSCKSKLLKTPELAAPCVSRSSVAQEPNETLISHCKVTDRNYSCTLSRDCICQLSVL